MYVLYFTLSVYLGVYYLEMFKLLTYAACVALLKFWSHHYNTGSYVTVKCRLFLKRNPKLQTNGNRSKVQMYIIL